MNEATVETFNKKQRHYLFRPQIITVTGTGGTGEHLLDQQFFAIHCNDNQVMQGIKPDVMRWLDIYERLNKTGDLVYCSTQNDTFDGDITPVHLTYADVICILSRLPNTIAKNRNWPDDLYMSAWLGKVNGKLTLVNCLGEPIANQNDYLPPVNLEEDSWFISIVKEEAACNESC